MQRLDFTSMIEKYPLLSLKDVSFLNDFFNSEDVKEILINVDLISKGIFKIGKISFGISFLAILLFVSLKYFESGFILVNSLIDLFFSAIFAGIISLISMGLYYNFGSKTKPIKNKLMPLFVSKINGDFFYSPKGSYYTESISKLATRDFIKKYSNISKQEDSIEYKIKAEGNNVIDIFGTEVLTTKRVKTKNGHRDVKNNHFYILKVLFNNPRFRIKTPIKLIEDLSDNQTKKILKIIGIQLAIIMGFLGIISGDENSDGFLPEFWELVNNNIEITTVFLVGMFFVIYFIYSYLKGNGRVKVENIDFEKEFDVYSDDQIESRQLLTPSFMYRLVDFVNKISRNRVYELYFHDNYFYLKYNIMATNSIVNMNPLGSNSYLEFVSYKGVYKNMEKFVEFYLEIKNITKLSKELKLFYYDKGMMTSEILKGGDVNYKPNMNHVKKRFFFF